MSTTHIGCACGSSKPIYCKDMCLACYHRDYRAKNRERVRHIDRRRHGRATGHFQEFTRVPVKGWGART